MSKRSAPQFLSPEPVEVKKQKRGIGPVKAYAPSLSPRTESATAESPEDESIKIVLKEVEYNEIEAPEVESNEVDLPEAELPETELPETELPEPESTEMKSTKTHATKTTPKDQTKRKAGEGFIPWTPGRALEPLPELQPHWGVVPRRGGYERPSMPQPPARDSDGSIRPPLWEDRKGAVRLKRGSRFIDGYDQADHMWLPLMDVRPVSAKNQKPRRKVIGYWYPHGMPADWNDSAVLNDVNKALQEAIKSNSNKDAPYSPTERQILAQIFAEDPEISLLDAAELFNKRAHPVTGSEEGRYPTGRFTESIQHEFRNYQSVYVKGEVPTATTPKESAIDEHYQIWKAEQEQAKIDASTQKKEAKAAAKAEKQAAKEAAKEAKAKATAEKKEVQAKAKADKEADKKTKKPRAKNGDKKMSETAGVTKKKRPSKQPYSAKHPYTLEEMVARADATAIIVAEKDTTEKAAKQAAEEAVEPTAEQNEDLPPSPGATTKNARANKIGKKMSDSAGVTKNRSPKQIFDDEKMVALAAEIIKKNAAEKAAKEVAEMAAEMAAEKAANGTAEKVVETTDDEILPSGKGVPQSLVATSPPTEKDVESTQAADLTEDEILRSDEGLSQSLVASSPFAASSPFTTTSSFITSSSPFMSLTATSSFTATGSFTSFRDPSTEKAARSLEIDED